MTLRDFIKQNREELDKAIHNVVPNVRLNNEERRQWIMNDEGLYRWARSEGVTQSTSNVTSWVNTCIIGYPNTRVKGIQKCYGNRTLP